MKRILTIFMAILTLYAYSSISAANVEKTLGFQGQLFESNAAKTGSVNAIFTFYDSQSGGSVTGSPIAKTVTVSNGYFGTQFSESDTTGVDFNQQLYLEVSINGTTLSPRTSVNPTVSSLKTFGTFSYASAPTVGPAGSLYFNTTDNALYTSDGTSWTTASSSWLTNGTTTYYTAGNVRIGTSTPADSLHIVGGRLRIENSGNAEMILKSTSSTTATVGFRNSADSTRGLVSYNFALEQMSFRVNGISDRLVISSTGLVGIGTSTPIARLSVKGSGSGILAQFSDSSDISRFTVLETGNVGIGSSTPSAKLTVAGDIRIDDTISRGLKLMRSGIAIGDITTSNSRLTFQDRAGAGVEFTSSSSVSIMMLTATGNLGVGTSTPQFKLDVQDLNNATVAQFTSDYTGGDGKNMVQL